MYPGSSQATLGINVSSGVFNGTRPTTECAGLPLERVADPAEIGKGELKAGGHSDTKTDQHGQGQHVAIWANSGEPALCPAVVLDACLAQRTKARNLDGLTSKATRYEGVIQKRHFPLTQEIDRSLIRKGFLIMSGALTCTPLIAIRRRRHIRPVQLPGARLPGGQSPTAPCSAG